MAGSTIDIYVLNSVRERHNYNIHFYKDFTFPFRGGLLGGVPPPLPGWLGLAFCSVPLSATGGGLPPHPFLVGHWALALPHPFL